MQKNNFTLNNFDLIRLFAALQVAFNHSIEQLKIIHPDWLLLDIINTLPGVPIFFFISGFLISKSFENSSGLLNYAQKRILRIYPGLIICVSVSIISVWLLGYFSTANASITDILTWYIAQISFVQCYNPSFMRAYGVGTLDGSLWTIGVELQFYVLIPVIYSLFGTGKNTKRTNVILLLLITAFIVPNRLFVGFEERFRNEILFKVLGISFIPWFYMFLTGVLLQRNYDFLKRYLENRAHLMFALYCPLSLVMYKYFHFALGNYIGPLLYVPLILTLFSAAFSKRDAAVQLLNKNDVSYGIYIYHMPVVNALIYLGLAGTIQALWLALSLTFIIAFLSWVTVEKPSLKLKKHALISLRENNPLFAHAEKIGS